MATTKFGNPESGTLSAFQAQFSDTSWNFFAPHVQMLATNQTSTGWKARLIGDDSMTFAGEGPLSRIHGIGFASTPAYYGYQKECWLSRSLAVPSGFTNQTKTTVDEVHGANNTGPAPLNLGKQTGNYWRIYIRGGTSNTGNYDSQWCFGQTEGGTLNPGIEHEQNWAGGNKLCVLDERVDFILGFYFDNAVGWFEAWARWGGATTYTNIVPRKSNIPTAYSAFGAPFLSLYYFTGAGVQNAVDIYEGHYSDTFANAVAAQAAQLGTTTPSVPTTGPNAEPQISTNLAGADVNPAGTPYTTGYSRGVGSPASSYKILSNLLTGTTDNTAQPECYISTQSSGPDVGFWFQFGDLSTVSVGEWFNQALRIQNPGATASFYALSFGKNSDGTFAVDLYKTVAGASTFVGRFDGTAAVASFSSWSWTVQGAATVTVRAKRWNGLADWVQQGSDVQDTAATVTGAGYPGFSQARGSSYTVKQWGLATLNVTAPSLLSSPSITGFARVGGTLTTSDGVWLNFPTSFAYQWATSTTGTSGWGNVGSNANSYVAQSGDLNKYLRCTVTASNYGASTAAASGSVQILANTVLRISTPRVANPAGRISAPSKRLQTTGGGF